MMFIWKDNTEQEAIFYRDGHPFDNKLITPIQADILKQEQLKENEIMVTAYHNPGFDGPWPTQEQMDYNMMHRWDFIKFAKVVYLNPLTPDECFQL